MTTLTRTRTRTGTSTQTQSGLDSVSRGSVAAMGGVSALIGLWAAACFVGAMVSSGPLSLAKGFFSAVTGM